MSDPKKSAGFNIKNSDGVTIQDCVSDGPSDGVRVSGSRDVRIERTHAFTDTAVRPTPKSLRERLTEYSMQIGIGIFVTVIGGLALAWYSTR